VLYGDSLPPGGFRVAEDETAPVVVVPGAVGAELLAQQRAGIDVGIAIGPGRTQSNAARGFVAGFSSQGLAFDDSVKPDVAAPGVAIATSEPGAATDGSPLYGTINGTSAAAASVAGAAMLLAQMRPDISGPALKSLLVGYAQRGGAPATAVGAGTFRLGTSAVGEVSSEPATLGFGLWGGKHWHATRTLVVRNSSTRRLQLSVASVADGDSEALAIEVTPKALVLRPGRSAPVKLTVRAANAPQSRVVTGAIEVSALGSETLRVPWAIAFRAYSAGLLAHVSLSDRSFKPSDTEPSVLTVQAGNLVRDDGLQIEPVSRLDLTLYRSDGSFVGVLARLRDLLPGAYTFGITGRGPSSARLTPGGYELRLAAWPTLPQNAQPSRAQVKFRIE
jgi:hypothetical protein